jgi:hypothetical protein
VLLGGDIILEVVGIQVREDCYQKIQSWLNHMKPEEIICEGAAGGADEEWIRVRTKWKGERSCEILNKSAFNSAAHSFRPFSGKDKIRSNPQGRLAKNFFIHAHRFLLVSLVSLSMKPLGVVHSI